MFNVELLSALAIGFFGSFHCVGMCGPIALALPVPTSDNLSFVTGRILYNLGRVITYSFLGAVFGFIGSRFYIYGFQQFLSLGLGATILITVLTPRSLKIRITQSEIVRKISSPIKNSIGKLFSHASFSSMFLIGLLNGLLPCGFVYVGLAGSIASGDAITGAAFMILFGLGTIPAMLAVSIFGKYFSTKIRNKINRAVPALAAMLAIIFILRGLNLGIPYLSPGLSQQPFSTEEMCE